MPGDDYSREPGDQCLYPQQSVEPVGEETIWQPKHPFSCQASGGLLGGDGEDGLIFGGLGNLLILLFSLQFSFFLGSMLGHFLLFLLAFVFTSLVTHI